MLCDISQNYFMLCDTLQNYACDIWFYEFISQVVYLYMYNVFLGSGYQIEAMIRFQGSVLASLQYEKSA